MSKLVIILFVFLFAVITAKNPILKRLGSITDNIKMDEADRADHAVTIFNKYGVQRHLKNHVCRSIDNETNRLYGDMVCKFTLQKMKHKSENANGDCVELKLPSKIYKHGSLNGDEVTNLAFKCNYGDGPFDHVFILNGPNTHHYIFKPKSKKNDGKTEITIWKIFNIAVSIKDFPEIPLRVTNDPGEADNILGEYGTVPPKYYKKHVCRINKYTGKFYGYTLCKKILEQSGKTMSGSAEKCRSITVHRNLQDGVAGSRVGLKADAWRCSYDVMENGKKMVKWIAVFNTLSYEMFYVAEVIEDNNNDAGEQDEYKDPDEKVPQKWSVKSVQTIKQ